LGGSRRPLPFPLLRRPANDEQYSIRVDYDDIQRIDIKTAFLHGVLPDNETTARSNQKASRSLAKRRGYDAIRKWGFRRISNEWCVYCDLRHPR